MHGVQSLNKGWTRKRFSHIKTDLLSLKTKSRRQMIQNTLPSHRAFVVPHHSSKTTVLASALLVAQAHGRLPVSAENLYAGLVLGAIFLRLLTTYLIKVKQKI